MPAEALTVVCMKWGDRYPSAYVNRLRNAVAAHLARPHRFLCMTDDPKGLEPGIEATPFPDFPLERRLWGAGMWPKLLLFRPGLVPDGTPTLFLDLDVMIIGDLTPFAELLSRDGGLRIIREWNPSLVRLLPVAMRPDRGGNSSVLGWIAGEQDHLLARFVADPDGERAALRNDQEFITAHAHGRGYWPNDWCASFKRHCVWYWPLSLVLNRPQPPRWARVLVFHGKPDPVDLIGDDPKRRWGARRKFGHGPVPWVRDYWDRFAEQAAAPGADG